MAVVWAVVSIVVWLLLAAMTASMAAERDQPPTLWFVVGLFFPILGMVVLAILGRAPETDPGELTTAGVARRNPVAQALAARAGTSADGLAQATQLPPKTVAEHLRSLRVLGLADRDASGRWSLTDEGVEALGRGEPAGANEP